MKKSNILIAAFAVLISAASAARAERVVVDFDGRTAGDGNFMEAVKSAKASPAIPPVPNITPCDPLSFTPGTPQTGLCLPQWDFSHITEGIVNGVIQGAIEVCAAESKEAVMIDLKNLLKYGTMNEKAAFVYNKRGTYSFPAGIIARHFDTSDGEASGNKSRDSLNLTCNSWTTVQVCTNRQVCRIACAAAAAGAGAAVGGNVGAAAAIGASGQICQELCENVKECSDVRECASWSSTAGTGTDAHGNYRGRTVAFQN